jgi:nucleoid DNA-binding protein
VYAQNSKDTGLTRKQVDGEFDTLHGVIKKSLRGGGLFTEPGLMKLKVVYIAATYARVGVNPFTGEKMMFKAKPAS